MIFNVAIDAVIQHWVIVVPPPPSRKLDRPLELQFRPYWQFSTPIMDSSRHQRAPAFRDHSTPKWASLTEWASKPTRGRW